MEEKLGNEEVDRGEIMSYIDDKNYSNLLRSLIHGKIPLVAKTAEGLEGYKLDERMEKLKEQMPLAADYAEISEDDILRIKKMMGEIDETNKEVEIDRAWFEEIKAKIEKMVGFLRELQFTTEEIIQNTL